MSSLDHRQRRQACLERAGWNSLHLDPVDLDFDLLTDVPPRSFVAEVREEGSRAAAEAVREPELVELATRLYGPARYVVSTKGRAAELALFAGLARPQLTVVTHGLFRSTQHALHRYGNAKLEIAPRARPSGTADLDLGWLDQRLAQGGVDLVYLEPCNNALGGWPLSLEHVRLVRERCSAAGALLVLDCARLLSNTLALGLPLAAAAEMCGHADAFTVSCSKELLAPYGALVGVRAAELERKIFSHCADEGTLLEPLDARARLAGGMRRVLADPSPLVERRALVARLAAALQARGVPILEPVGSHAVYVVVPPELGPGDPLRLRGLEAWLYLLTGVRALAFPNPILKQPLMRLPLMVARYDASEIDRIADGLGNFFRRASEAPVLEPGEPGPQPMLGRYVRRA